MPTAKFTSEPGTPEYQASEWLMTIHNAYREIDPAISKSPDPAAFIERLRERVRRDYEQNREQMGWTERTRDTAEHPLTVVLDTVKLPKMSSAGSLDKLEVFFGFSKLREDDEGFFAGGDHQVADRAQRIRDVRHHLPRRRIAQKGQ